MEKNAFRDIFKPRDRFVHKGLLGKVLIIAGSGEMSGAGFLAGLACLRAGIGLLEIAYPQGLETFFRQSLPEALHLPLPAVQNGYIKEIAFSKLKSRLDSFDALLIGPGLTTNKQTQKFILKVLDYYQGIAVIDADALNTLAMYKKSVDILKLGGLKILTPHLGEMSRLTGLNVSEISKNKKKIALKYAKIFQSIIVLKGPGTVVADFQGMSYVNETGSPALATPGSGDVLAGIILAFVSQNKAKLFSSVSAAIFLHGLAGDLAEKELGERAVLARDLIFFIPRAFKKAGR